MIRKAIRQAEKSQFTRARVGAVIVRGGRILGVGSNRVRYYHQQRTHPHRHIQSLHAEIAAILDVRNPSQLKGSTMFVARIKKDGSLALAKPCAYCQRVINNFGIKRVVFTTDTGEIQNGSND